MNEEKKNNVEDVEEKEVTKARGGAALLGILLGFVVSVAGIILGAIMCGENGASALSIIILVASILLFCVMCVLPAGLKVIHPNEAAVYTLFGKYYGTIKKAGFYYTNPFVVCYNPSAHSAVDELVTSFSAAANSVAASETPAQSSNNKKISTKTMTLDNRKQKVNDALGNPIIIGAAVIWKVVNPTKAVFNVENYKSFLSIQCDAIIRNNARLYPYDVIDEDDDDGVEEKTLRGSSQEIADNMKIELQKRVQTAGIEIEEVRITHLAYSDEIAAAMLQRQQATAIIAARQKIVEGAVGMVKMAIDQLGEDEIVVLDEERKAAMVSNLLVVLCGNKEAQPVVNSGSIY
ncbi:MAG: SPFH domain-containing protein [Wujia sp.]